MKSMDKKEVRKKIREYANLIKKYFPVKQVILYGSYASLTARKDSDIDAAVVVKKIKGDFLEKETELYKLRRNIDERIEPVLLETDDDRSGFLAEIIKKGEVIYSI